MRCAAVQALRVTAAVACQQATMVASWIAATCEGGGVCRCSSVSVLQQQQWGAGQESTQHVYLHVTANCNMCNGRLLQLHHCA